MTGEKIMYAELNIVCVIILLVLARKLRMSSKSIEQAYLTALLGTLSAMFLLDAFWVVINGNPMFPPVLNYLANVGFFTVTAIAPYFAACYLRITLTNTTFTPRQHTILQIPALVILMLSSASFRTGLIFTVSEDNVYARGPFYYAQFMIPLVYMVCEALITLIFALRAKNEQTRSRGIIMSIMAVLPVCGSILETFFPSLTIVCAFLTITMVSIIFNFQQRQITKDTLTQLSNRYDLMLYLDDQLQSPVLSDGQALYVMFADIDYFKSINDTFGHLEGDHALCYVAEALRTVCRSANAYPARLGGDEFVIAFRSHDDRGAESFRRELKDNVAARSEGLPYRLSLSIGYTRCAVEDSNASVVLDRADGKLYEEKNVRPSREYILRQSDSAAAKPQSADAR